MRTLTRNPNLNPNSNPNLNLNLNPNPNAQVVNQNMDGVKTQANKTFVRVAGGETWRDDTLKDWPENDFRLFIGDLSKDVKEKDLEKVPSKPEPNPNPNHNPNPIPNL